jgi:predicted O-linked N-acetylglucosamine transferase (SPINDLY family)
MLRWLSRLAGRSEPVIDVDQVLSAADELQKQRDHRGAAAHLESALAQVADVPARSRIMLRLAAVLIDSGRPSDAERWYRQILQAEPGNGDALLCLASLREADDLEEARSLMRLHAATRPDAASLLRRALMLPPVLQSAEEGEAVRRRLEQDLDEVIGLRLPPVRQPEFEIGSAPFLLAYYGASATQQLRKFALACRSVYPTVTECRRKPLASGGKIHVGFISSHFRSHSVTRALFGLIADLPRERFSVSVFAIAPPPGDPWSARIAACADRFVALPFDLERAREAIAGAALDIAFFTDIGMDPLTYFLAFWRLAPVQVNTWGHPVTSGIETLDYYVSSDQVEAPGAEAHYTERLLRLPGYYMPRYERPQLAGERKPRSRLGLPERRHLYYCPQNLFKLHPDFDAALKMILEADGEGELVLVEGRDRSGDALRQRLLRTLGPLAARTRFLPRTQREEFLQCMAAADVVLDPFHFGGCNSSCEALSFGVPVVTLPGPLLQSRFTLGLYREMGLTDCIASSPDEFAAIALRLGRDADYRRGVGERIAQRCERLFERPDAGRALGEALAAIAEAAR